MSNAGNIPKSCMFNVNPDIEVLTVGEEKNVILIVDNVLEYPDEMIQCAISGEPFQSVKGDFYPGIKKSAPVQYSRELAKHSVWLLHQVFKPGFSKVPADSASTFAIATCAPDALLPVQSIPHFDQSDSRQFAVVHYLCDEAQGGTSFYRHRRTGYESIQSDRVKEYISTLERQATTEGLPKPGYIKGDTNLFECIASVKARNNRAIIYRSNVLHSGNINVECGLKTHPETGRLTITSSIQI